MSLASLCRASLFLLLGDARVFQAVEMVDGVRVELCGGPEDGWRLLIDRERVCDKIRVGASAAVYTVSDPPRITDSGYLAFDVRWESDR